MERPIREVDGVEREDADAVGATRSALDCRRAGNCGALDGRHKGAIDDGLDEEHVVEAHPGADNAIHARATDEATERAYDGSKVRRWRARFTLRPLQSLVPFLMFLDVTTMVAAVAVVLTTTAETIAAMSAAFMLSPFL
jgi:hypothetical protein